MNQWTSVNAFRSANPSVTKYVFEKDGCIAEAVLYKYPTYAQRTVICCSTQSGCPVGCRFCGAGDHFIRSLTIDEIISQPDYLLEQVDCDPKEIGRLQIMFMSMGEPMLNLPATSAAIRELHRKYPRSALLVSTSGPRGDYESLIRLSCDVPAVGLQFSVHESTDEARNRLIPLPGKLTLAQIAAEGTAWFKRVGRKPFFNYCVHERNGTDADADRLAELFSPQIWCATISVICEREVGRPVDHEAQRCPADVFKDKLEARGFDTRLFDPAGQDDIGGGCGQLWFVQDYFAKHRSLASATCGMTLPVLHANSGPVSEPHPIPAY